MNQKKVVLGMSGGVDSSAAAYLLKKQGYEVIGVTMINWRSQEISGKKCGSLLAAEDARKVADDLGIEHHVVDFTKEFKEQVMDYFVGEYLHGRTPNPCNVCNRFVKWEALLAWARSMGADYIATGHYAQIRQLENGRYVLAKAASDQKDQTYALCNLTQDQLAHTLMPVGGYTKDRIREFAEEAGLSIASKPDSMEICFIPDNDYAGFIQQYPGAVVPPAGNFVSESGEILGQHKGIIHYTIGQRKGLGIAFGKPMFVTAIRVETNEVVLSDNEALFQTELVAENMNWMGIEALTQPMEAVAKIRYSHKGAICRIEPIAPGKIKCVFQEAQRAITPGQALVLYQDDYLLGGGVIC